MEWVISPQIVHWRMIKSYTSTWLNHVQEYNLNHIHKYDLNHEPEHDLYRDQVHDFFMIMHTIFSWICAWFHITYTQWRHVYKIYLKYISYAETRFNCVYEHDIIHDQEHDIYLEIMCSHKHDLYHVIVLIQSTIYIVVKGHIYREPVHDLIVLRHMI